MLGLIVAGIAVTIVALAFSPRRYTDPGALACVDVNLAMQVLQLICQNCVQSCLQSFDLENSTRQESRHLRAYRRAT